MARRKRTNSLVGMGTDITNHYMNRPGNKTTGALLNTINRREAYNIARRVSMGGKGG